MSDLLLDPFANYQFMWRALAGSACLGGTAACVGVFLVLRRMSLMGDAIAHGILPGAALGFWWAGMSLSALTLGGLFAGLAMAGIATWISRHTALKEDASLAAIYPISLASGMLLLSLSSHRVDLTHLLFGSALAVDSQTLKAMLAVALVTLVIGGVIFRALFLDTFDPVFLSTVSRSGPFAHAMFMVLVVLNLVLGFQAVGALMMVGLMMLPATAAMFWSRRIAFIMMVAAGIAVISVYGGLLLSFHGGLASGPCIVLMAGVFYIVSMVCGPVNGLAWR